MVTISRWRVRRETENVEVPEGCIVCPICKGSAEIRVRWSGVGHTDHDWKPCPNCSGEGYVNEAEWKRWTEAKKVSK